MIHQNLVFVPLKRGVLLGCLLGAAFVAGCKTAPSLMSGQYYNSGYNLDTSALDFVKIGSSREQVILSLGSPSLKAMYNNEVFYYISQTTRQPFEFMKPTIIDRKILAIYFDKNGTVEKIARYGLKDGRIFDFLSQTTPTGGRDQSFLTQLIHGTKAMPKLPTTGR